MRLPELREPGTAPPMWPRSRIGKGHAQIKFPGSMRNLQVSIEPERALVVVHFLIANGTVLISQIQYEGDDKSYADADTQNNPIRRISNTYRHHYSGRDDQAGGALYA